MNQRSRKTKLKFRPLRTKRRVKSRAVRRAGPRKPSVFTARLTIDVTPDLRGRIKISAFRRGITVAHMLRTLLLKTFPRTRGGRR